MAQVRSLAGELLYALDIAKKKKKKKKSIPNETILVSFDVNLFFIGHDTFILG